MSVDGAMRQRAIEPKMKLARAYWPTAYSYQNIRACFLRFIHFVQELFTMSKQYSIGANRHVTVKKQDGDLKITIAESGSDVKIATFQSQRWVMLSTLIGQLDEGVNQLMTKQNVDLKLQIGGKWYASISTGYACIDLREWYFHPIKGVRPTTKGIAIRISEWQALKRGVSTTFHQVPDSSDHHPVCLSTGSSEPGGSACVSRMTSLSKGKYSFFIHRQYNLLYSYRFVC